MALSKGAKGAILIGLLGKGKKGEKPAEPSEGEDRAASKAAAMRDLGSALAAKDWGKAATAFEAAYEICAGYGDED